VIGIIVIITAITDPKQTIVPATATPKTVAAKLQSSNTPVPTVTNALLLPMPTPTSTSVPKNTPSPTPALSLEEQIMVVLGDSNRNVKRISKIEFMADVINIEWTIDDNFTENMIRKGAQMDVADLLKAIRASGLPFGLINLTGTFSMRDKFGNIEETPVVWLTYSAETIRKIDWHDSLFINASLWTVVYDIADSKKLHPAMEE
jgi:hypothetical protein